MSVAIADEVQLPTPEEIDSVHLLTPILEAETEAESETALQALADLDADGKLLALAQIAEFAEEQNDSEILIAFLPYIGEDLMDSLDATTATAILESNAYSDLFKIYIIDLANTLDNFSSVSYNEALVDVAMDSSKSDELRVYAAHDIDTSMVSNPVAVYEVLYDDASSMDDKMLMLKDIGFVDPATGLGSFPSMCWTTTSHMRAVSSRWPIKPTFVPLTESRNSLTISLRATGR